MYVVEVIKLFVWFIITGGLSCKIQGGWFIGGGSDVDQGLGLQGIG